MPSLTNNIIYSRKRGRIAILESAFILGLRFFLRIKTKKYIAQYKRQLVVFSFDEISHVINLEGIFEKEYLDTFFEWL